ncbi:MAG: transposase [Okeania sp. SIO2C9]|uniref:transposase n=1 Tax=Okeania sp. SIO2C9 TaxID=2607791 RepID=UPI0013C27C3B|nr:transposase [Okeania sp. SIO2C9]NEQ71622.1 transposase [Okeania sp. SIO2C9]
MRLTATRGLTVKKPDLALKLVQKILSRKYPPGVVLVDGGYGNNSSFLEELQKLELNYIIGGLAKNRKVNIINPKTGKKQLQKRLDEIILS